MLPKPCTKLVVGRRIRNSTSIKSPLRRSSHSSSTRDPIANAAFKQAPDCDRAGSSSSCILLVVEAEKCRAEDLSEVLNDRTDMAWAGTNGECRSLSRIPQRAGYPGLRVGSRERGRIHPGADGR